MSGGKARPQGASGKATEGARLALLACASGAIAGAGVSILFVSLRLPFAPESFSRALLPIMLAFAGSAALIFCLLLRKLVQSKAAVLLASIATALLAALGYLALSLDGKPNVLLIVSDATRADHLSCYGYGKETSPNLDALAREAVLFEQAIAQGTHTIVATPCILSSLYPSQHGLTTYRDVLSDSALTIAEILAAEGYETYGLSTNPHITEATGFAQGFEIFESDRSWLNTNATRVVDRFLAWLAANRGKRFFAFLFFIDPHSPYEPPGEFLEKLGGDPGFLVRDWSLDSLKNYAPQEQRQIIARYDAEIASLDHELGRLFTGLSREGLDERTLIVYTSDHGEALWEHDRVGHGDTLHEELLRIPLIMKLPRIFRIPGLEAPAGRTLKDAVAQVDIVPTLLEFLGIGIPEEVQGISLLPLIYRGTYPQGRPIFSEEILLQLGPYNLKSVRVGRWKLILDQNPRSGAVKRELYDLAKDPREEVNAVLRETEVTKELERELIVFMGRMERMRIVSGERSIPTESMLESLKALGYIE